MECSFTVGVHVETGEELRDWAEYEGVSIAHIVRRAVEHAIRARRERMAQVDLFDFGGLGEGVGPVSATGTDALSAGEGI